MLSHLAASGHELAVDCTHLQMYCRVCKDYVYHEDVDAMILNTKKNLLNQKQQVENPANRRAQYKEWDASTRQSDIIGKHSTSYTVPRHLVGLRGLLNLGNTCFMNVILQAFLHNPLLRNFFLADMHNWRVCKRSSETEKICLGCELDYLFAQVFSGARAPYNPHHFLYSMWKHEDSFIGYEQQDAHEFLISILNGVHTHCGGTPNKCKCIVHRVFSGGLRSDVTCVKCGNVSTSYEPFFDISLDIPKSPSSSGDCKFSDCLKQYTHPERLESEEKFFCGNCKSYQGCIKQLSFKTLPLVLCFHMKRFEQIFGPKTMSSKVDTYIAFPEVLDMTPYLSHSILNGGAAPGNEEVFDLFAVVNHHGKMENGHYTAFIKHSGEWVKADDPTLTKASLRSVLMSQGYMLFYVRRKLEYQELFE